METWALRQNGGGSDRRRVAAMLADKFGATLISVRQNGTGIHQYDPRSGTALAAGDTIFYISETRVDVDAITWQE